MEIRCPALSCQVISMLILVVLGGGCVDAKGNRVTVQEWLSASSQPAESKEGQMPKDRRQQIFGDEQRSHAPSTPESTHGPSGSGKRARTAADSPADAAPSSSVPAKTQPRPRIEQADEQNGEAGEQGRSQPQASPNAIHSDVLLVNKETISVNDILEPISPELEKLSGEVPPNIYFGRATELIRQQIIEAVAQQLIWRKAQKDISEDMEKGLKKAVDKMEKERINREFQGRETLYDKYLAKHGKTRAEVRERLRRSIVIDSYLRERLLPLVPNPRKQDLLNYYNANIGEFTKHGRREMYLIDVPVAAFLPLRKSPSPGEAQEATEKARAAIEEAAAALAAGESFEAVARRISKGSNAEEGGAWGFIESPLKGRWEAPSKKLFEMKEGQISEILEVAKGYFIVKVGKVEERQIIDFNDAQPQIANALKQRRFNKLRADFLQDELNKSTLGSLDEFVAEVLRAIPNPKMPER
jgi:parvulin-like peptidyl-prolyl isomerase